MPFDTDDLVKCLDLRDAGDGVLEGDNLDIGYYRVFGGQILAQLIAAATAVSPGKAVKSLHVLFPREGDTAKPMRYRVSKLQDGRTYGATTIVGEQLGDDGSAKVITTATASMHIDEDGLRRSDAPRAVGSPDDATPADLNMIPWETRIVGGVDLDDREASEARLDWWMRTPAVGDEPHVHQALLAHATDLTLIGTALRGLDGYSQADSTVRLHTAVTSHTVWFHQPFRADDWLLISQAGPVVAKGRSFGRGDVFAGDDLVASFAQEAMVRQIEPTG